MKWVCEQRGCGEFAEDYFDDDDEEHLCPVCANPLFEREGEVDQDNGNGDPEWTDLTKDELIAQLEDWGVTEGWNSRSTKDELIECLEVAEAAAE